jgi:hypothetical protein
MCVPQQNTQIVILKENITNEIRQIDSMILGRTTDNMQRCNQMCLMEDAGDFLQTTLCQFVQHETKYVSYQHYHILFIHS